MFNKNKFNEILNKYHDEEIIGIQNNKNVDVLKWNWEIDQPSLRFFQLYYFLELLNSSSHNHALFAMKIL